MQHTSVHTCMHAYIHTHTHRSFHLRHHQALLGGPILPKSHTCIHIHTYIHTDYSISDITKLCSDAPFFRKCVHTYTLHKCSIRLCIHAHSLHSPYIHTHMHTHTDMHTHSRHLPTQSQLHQGVYPYMVICKDTYIYTYTHTYTHTYIHTHGICQPSLSFTKEVIHRQ